MKIKTQNTSLLKLFLYVFLQSVWYIKNQKGESQGRGKILTKYYATRRKLIKAGLIRTKTTDAVLFMLENCKFYVCMCEYALNISNKMNFMCEYAVNISNKVNF